jgi:hypothetical protein
VSEHEDYASAAEERRRDAARLKGCERRLASVYLLGYAVECGLKAQLRNEGRRFEKKGREGHNLYALWEAAGYKRADVTGLKRLFLDEWNTSLRYRGNLPANLDGDAMYEGGRELMGYVMNRSKRVRRRRRP